MSRSLTELEIRASSALARVSQEVRARCVEIGRIKSPSAAYDLAMRIGMLEGFGQIQQIDLAKAVRWLAVVRRDYGMDKFEMLVRSLAE